MCLFFLYKKPEADKISLNREYTKNRFADKVSQRASAEQLQLKGIDLDKISTHFRLYSYE